jgi:hypothetical protein
VDEMLESRVLRAVSEMMKAMWFHCGGRVFPISAKREVRCGYGEFTRWRSAVLKGTRHNHDVNEAYYESN